LSQTSTSHHLLRLDDADDVSTFSNAGESVLDSQHSRVGHGPLGEPPCELAAQYASREISRRHRYLTKGRYEPWTSRGGRLGTTTDMLRGRMNGEPVYPILASREWQPEYLYLNGSPNRNRRVPVSHDILGPDRGHSIREEIRDVRLDLHARRRGESVADTLADIRDEIDEVDRQLTNSKGLQQEIATFLQRVEVDYSSRRFSKVPWSVPGADSRNSDMHTTSSSQYRAYAQVKTRHHQTNSQIGNPKTRQDRTR
jgi:hypothetical protein